MLPRERLIAALDVPDAAAADRLAGALANEVGCLKIGLELFIATGPAFARDVARRAPLFLDLKLLDIPETVARAARAAAGCGARYLTVHAEADALRAAVTAAPQVQVLAVTVLTSANQPPPGYGSVSAAVLERARLAEDVGCYGVVCSALEAAAVRAACPALRIVTPGIRPRGVDAHDQARVATPAMAIAAGADLLVVGRPIRDAADPGAAARAIVEEIAFATAR